MAKRSQRISLPYGCSITGIPGNPKKGTADELTVFPSNWKNKNASVKKPWYIFFRFFDPLHKDRYPNGKLVPIRGMNDHNCAGKRREATEVIMQAELDDLLNGYNHITGKQVAPANNGESDILPTTYLPISLRLAAEKMKCEASTKSDINSTLTFVNDAIQRLRYTFLPVGNISRKHIVKILETCATHKPTWSEHMHNKYRSYLMSLFKIMIKWEAIESNPVSNIDKEVPIKTLRNVLSIKQRKEINIHLKANYYTFWRFLQIFFHSGGRISELLKVKVKDVNLLEQRYKVVVKKGKLRAEVNKTIKNSVLHLWKEALHGCKEDEEIFVFNKNLEPGGEKPIRREQITRRWSEHVKKKLKHLNITADFYSLKHSNTTEIAEMLSDADAARLNSHQGTAMVINVYDVDRADRQHERLKRVNNSFS